MPVHKRKNRSGQVVWYYLFDRPGSTRDNRDRASESGFSTKREAEDAEAIRRTEEQQRWDLAKAGATVAAALPKTLSMLLEEFFRQHVDENLAPKTIERYHEQAAYLDPELLRMPLAEITSPSDPRVESAVEARRPRSSYQASPSTVGQNSSEHRRRCLQCVRTRDPLGFGLG